MRKSSIQDKAPHSGAILAYGSSSRAYAWGPVAALISGFLLLTLIAFGWRALSSPLSLPESTYLLLYIRPSLQLPAGSPELWREKQAEAKPWPILGGLALDENAEHYAFTISPSLLSLWKFSSKQEIKNFELKTLLSFAGWKDYLKSTWLQIWPGNLGTGSASLESGLHFGGPISKGTWYTDLKVPAGSDADQNYLDQNFLDVQSLPYIWPIVESSLRRRGIDLNLAVPPATISWIDNEQDQIKLTLNFNEPLSAEARAQLAASVGLVEKQLYSLDDGTVITELITPVQALSQSSTDHWRLDDGKSLIFGENTVILGNVEQIGTKVEPPDNCTGKILAIFDRNILATFLERAGFEKMDLPNRTYWMEDGNKLKICTK